MTTTATQPTIEGGTPEERRVIEHLYETHGHLTPTIVLDEARSKDSPLHSHFAWDDTDAAERYRLQQAGGLIRRFRIIRSTEQGRVINVAKFTRTDDGTYRDTVTVVTTEQLRDQKVLQYMSRLERLRDELAQFEEFAAICLAIDTLG